MKIKIGYFLLSGGFIILVVGFAIAKLSESNPDLFRSNRYINEYIIPNSKIIEAIGFSIGILGALSEFLGINFREAASNVFVHRPEPRPSTQHFPFQIITRRDDVLPTMLSSPGFIPDHEIPYQYRLPDRKITDELRGLLFQYKRILVTGVAGVGKTREIGKLLLELVDEGYIVLLANSNARFDLPIAFPEGLRNRLIFVFDDIHQNCRLPPAESLIDSIATEDYLNNLFLFLQKSQARFTRSEIHAIFVSRSDSDSWQKLLHPIHKLWHDVIRYEIPFPDIEGQKRFVLDLSEKLGMDIEDATAYQIACANVYDGTFRNLIENLYRSKRENYRLSDDTFITKQLTWEGLYRDLCQRHRGVEYLFEALNILQEINIPKYLELTVRLAGALNHPILFGFPLINGVYERRYKNILMLLLREHHLDIKQPDPCVNRYEKEIAIYPLLLQAQEGQKDKYHILPHVWRFLKKIDDTNSWYAFAMYCIHRAKRIRLGVIVLTTCIKRYSDNSKCDNSKYLIARGLGLLMLGYKDYALSDVNKACKLGTERSKALILRGIIHELMGNHEMAQADYDNSVVLTEDADDYLNRASLLRLMCDYKASERELNKAIRLTPDDGKLYYERAEVRWMLGRHKEALSDLDLVIQQNPENIQAYLRRAEFFTADNKTRLAEADIKKALSLDENNSEIYYLKASIAYQKDELRTAEDLLSKAIQLSPYNDKYYQRRGAIRSKLHKHLQARQDFNRISPTKINKDIEKTNRIKSGGKRMTTKELFEFLETESLDGEFFLELARVLGRFQRYDLALDIYSLGIKKYPNFDKLYHNRAHIYEAQNKSNLALEDFETAMQLNPDNLENLRCKSEFLLAQGNLKAALKDLAHAVKTHPKDMGLFVTYLRAVLMDTKIDKLKSKFIENVKRNPQSARDLLALSYIYLREKEYGEAKKTVRSLLEIQHSDPDLAVQQLSLLSRMKMMREILLFPKRYGDELYFEASYQVFLHTSLLSSNFKRIIEFFFLLDTNVKVIASNISNSLNSIKDSEHHPLSKRELLLR